MHATCLGSVIKFCSKLHCTELCIEISGSILGYPRNQGGQAEQNTTGLFTYSRKTSCDWRVGKKWILAGIIKVDSTARMKLAFESGQCFFYPFLLFPPCKYFTISKTPGPNFPPLNIIVMVAKLHRVLMSLASSISLKLFPDNGVPDVASSKFLITSAKKSCLVSFHLA